MEEQLPYNVGDRFRRTTRGPTDTGVLCVFVPGLKGSVLKCDQCQKRSWPPSFLDSNVELLRRCLKKRSLNVARLMTADECACLIEHKQEVCGVLTEISLLHGLYERDIYASFLAGLQKDCDEAGSTDGGRRKPITLHRFPYDWTLGVRHAAEQLYTYLRRTSGDYSAVALVAHSMGGLVCRYMLEEILYKARDQDVAAKHLYRTVKLLYAMGVPHYGTISALHHLIDPSFETLTVHCQGIQSLYDLIPFSDLRQQIEGVVLEGEEQQNPLYASVLRCDKRYRSEMFLQRTDGKLTVDREHWLPQRLLNVGEATTSRDNRIDRASAISLLVQVLIRRFPVLSQYADRLYQGAQVHFALNASNRPAACVYVCVNAVGFKSPSTIDSNDRLFRECRRGDGTVCSVIDKPKRKGVWRRQTNWLKPLIPRNTDVETPMTETRSDTVETPKYSVHTKMLPHIDVFRVIHETLASDIYGGEAVGTRDGIRGMWRNFIRDQSKGAVVSTSSGTCLGWNITAANLNAGCCVLTVNYTPSWSDNGYDGGECDIDIGLVQSTRSERRVRSSIFSSTRAPIEDVTHIRVKISDLWSRITVILSGHYTLLNVRNIDRYGDS